MSKLDLICAQCHEDIVGPPVVSEDELYYLGQPASEFCSTGCYEADQESRQGNDGDPCGGGDINSSPSYRRGMIDAGRGHLLQ